MDLTFDAQNTKKCSRRLQLQPAFFINRGIERKLKLAATKNILDPEAVRELSLFTFDVRFA
jgi:hypothetical protein